MSDDARLPIDDAAAKTKELLKRKEELEAELKKIEAELRKSTTFSHSDGIVYSSRAGGFSRAILEKRFAANYSLNNQLNNFTNYNSYEEKNFETSSVFDLRGAFLSKKKETFCIYGRRPNLAETVNPRKFEQTRYYLGCMTELIQEHVQTLFIEQGRECPKKLSQCNVVVYHENTANFPTSMRRKFMLAAMGGFDFKAVNELVDSDVIYTGKMSPEFIEIIEEYKTVSKFIRRCYGAGMRMPFDGRIMVVIVNDEKIAEDVEEAITLLGGCPFVTNRRDKIPFGISHLIYDGKKIKDKAIGFAYRIKHDVFFKDLEIEFDRLKSRALD
ncbi:hypothetical protein FO519_006242 [Halicephalobus sp. NKZ332]|nr:hypothetical protein FO519_006242 [Halicephalobus sp. NKZ332]